MTEDKTYYPISIPDLNESPYIIKYTTLNNKTYYFEYKWNIRSQSCYLSIYLLENNTKIYILRSKTLVLYKDIARYVFNAENWSGQLFLKPLRISNFSNYNQQNISTDYELSYVPE